jgi:hypothetical protein
LRANSDRFRLRIPQFEPRNEVSAVKFATLSIDRPAAAALAGVVAGVVVATVHRH